MIPLLLNHLWQSTLVAGVVTLLALLLRKNGANARFILWFVASLKFLIPFSLLAMLGTAIAPSKSYVISTPLIAQIQPAAVPFTAEIGLGLAKPLPASPIALEQLLLGIWLAGTLGLLTFWSIKLAKLRAVARAAGPLPLASDIPVRSSSALMEPGLVGIWHPVLLLPEGIAERLAPGEIDAIIAHETCHYQRRDNLTAAIHMGVQAAFWFYPLVWWIGRKLVAEREQACDEAVVALGNDPGIYAESILKVCKFYLQSPLDCAPGVSGADLKKRVEAIIENRIISDLSRTKKVALVAIAAMIIGMPVAEGMIPQPTDFALSRATASPGIEAALRHMIEAWEEHRPDTGRLTPGMASLVSLAWPHTQQELKAWGKPTAIWFQGASPDGRELYSVAFTNALTSWEVGLAPDGRINGLEWWVAYARTDRTKPSPGTEAALSHQIEAWQRHQPAIDVMSPLWASATRAQQADIQSQFDSWGKLKSVVFDGVDFRGWDIYDIAFQKGWATASIGPLTADGKVDSIIFARRFNHAGPSPGTEASLRRYIESLERGSPNYDEMTPQLAATVKDQLPGILIQVRAWGGLRSLTFKSVATNGLDLYEVTFDHGRALWRIAPLTADGKVQMRGWSTDSDSGSAS
jgi:beta-lactamase regulating signal transducer with metallopeptidase domain